MKEEYFNSNVVEYNDVTQAVIWDKSDYSFIIQEFAQIRDAIDHKNKTKKYHLIDNIDERIQRSQNDQTVFDGHKPIEVIEKKDRVVAPGRSRCAELITGESNATFDNMAIGLSQIAVQDSDYKLYEEVGRVSSRLTGFVSAAGSVIKHVATFSPAFPSNTYWEVAPVDTNVESDEQAILARVVFSPDRPAVHVAGEDFFTVHHSTQTSSGA